jgi:hypothetical protein
MDVGLLEKEWSNLKAANKDSEYTKRLKEVIHDYVGMELTWISCGGSSTKNQRTMI